MTIKSVQSIVTLDSISKVYRNDRLETRALNQVSLTIEKGEFVSIMGPSGSGKSTLLHIIGLLDRPDEGSYQLDGEPIDQRTPGFRLAHWRGQKIGFVFQQFNLLPRTSALGNVMLPMIYQKQKVANRRVEAKALLESIGLGNKLANHPNQLSGGEQQRVAIARALVNRPQILLADEPTGNLDSQTGHQIMVLLRSLNKEGLTIIMVTHEKEIAAYAGRIIYIKDGRVS